MFRTVDNSTAEILENLRSELRRGSLIVAVLTNGLRVTEVPQEWQSVAVGCVILVAVYVDMLRRKGA